MVESRWAIDPFGASVSDLPASSRKSGSQVTPRWREMDSNPRPFARNPAFLRVLQPRSQPICTPILLPLHPFVDAFLQLEVNSSRLSPLILGALEKPATGRLAAGRYIASLPTMAFCDRRYTTCDGDTQPHFSPSWGRVAPGSSTPSAVFVAARVYSGPEPLLDIIAPQWSPDHPNAPE
jgi:hypothetical protein